MTSTTAGILLRVQSPTPAWARKARGLLSGPCLALLHLQRECGQPSWPAVTASWPRQRELKLAWAGHRQSGLKWTAH